MRFLCAITTIVLSLTIQASGFDRGWEDDLDPTVAPAENFDLETWKITLPLPHLTKPGKVLEIKEKELNGLSPYDEPYQHSEWFYTNSDTGAMVFRAPNHAPTTPNSSNARSELREMLRAGDTSIGTKAPLNNWALSSHPDASDFGGIGGYMSAILAVDWVSTSGNDAKFPAHSVVVGQIHGSGKTEPLKIFFRKMPNHDTASLFFTYEIRPADQNQRYDVHFNVWGDYSLTKADAAPVDGLELGELFSYEINVEDTMMSLVFTKNSGETVNYSINLAGGLPGHPLDTGYDDDWMYFKAGAYNQCNTGTTHPVWGTGCSNNGIGAGDYAQVTFYEFESDH